MNADPAKNVCVVIAARNAGGTIGRAIASALAEPETAEVFVVDDGSTDDTSGAARAADDGSGRLTIARFCENAGPSAARNHAIAHTGSPYIGILDADDFYLPGRLSRLLAQSDFDLVADNIAFIDETQITTAHRQVDRFAENPRELGLTEFVEGNISRRGVRRGEIGFLKPLLRREFLAEHGLRYRETMRLGEDYDLYARALAHGARYRLIHTCGYAAVVRSDSLSGRHRTADLRQLFEADRAIIAECGVTGREAAALRRHESHIRTRYELRHFLDIRKDRGPLAALGYALGNPRALPAIAGGILADKSARYAPARRPATAAFAGTTGLRYLLPGTPEGSL